MTFTFSARLSIVRTAVMPLMLVALLLPLHCGTGEQTHPLRQKYNLSEGDWEVWNRLQVDAAEAVTSEFWGLLGRGSFDSALLLVEQFGDRHMNQIFHDRIEKLWLPVVNWPAASMTEEPGIGLGPSQTIGFRTWAQLWAGGFQRAVLCDDSITVYFIFSGYWQTDSIPLYAAVSCGDFGRADPQWRPFPNVVFSLDSAEETVKALGGPQRSRTIDEFAQYLRTRTFGSFGR